MTTTIKKQIDKQTQKFIKAGCPVLAWPSAERGTYYYSSKTAERLQDWDRTENMKKIDSRNREQRRHPKKFL